MNPAPVQVSEGLWQWTLPAYPEAAAFSPDGTVAAFALGDGSLCRIDLRGGDLSFTGAHHGSATCLAAHPGGGFVSGGDDGRLCHAGPDNAVTVLLEAPGEWIEHLAPTPDGAFLAAGLGRQVAFLDLIGGGRRTIGPHPSTVSGLAVSPGGGVLAVSHLGGVSLWDLTGPGDPVVIAWKGASRALAFSPDSRHLACASAENAVHVLDMESRSVFSLTGLPGRAAGLAWTRDSRLLLTTGGRAVLGWPVPECLAPNPTPVAFAAQEEARLCVVAVNPKLPFVAAGFTDGQVLLAEPSRQAALHLDHAPGEPVTALAWSPSGLRLATGLEDGRALILDLAALLEAS